MAAGHGQLFDPEISRPRVFKVANKSTKTKAKSSLPDILTIKNVDGRIGVFSTCPLTQATQFGPLEAPLVKKNQMEDTNFPMKLDIRKCRRLDHSDSSYIYYDTSDENMCNWMMFVQPAKYYAKQNLCAHQVEDFVFYTATRDISADEELKVWYSPSYAKFLSVSVLTPTSGLVSAPKVGSHKAKNSNSSRRMQVYPNSMISERDVHSVPPKKRGWRRAKDKRTEDRSRNMAGHFPVQSNESALREKIRQAFTCRNCGKAFKSNDKLQIHSVTHSNVRNFLCHCCGATFKRRDKLHDHMVKSHYSGEVSRRKKLKKPLNLEDFSFRCSQCKIGFNRRGMFINHLIKRHPDTQTDNVEELTRPIYITVRDFHCPYCEKVYKSSAKRKLHIEKQHPGRQIPVSVKKRKSNSGNNDATIIDKETVEAAPVCCLYCNRQYSTKHKQNKHMREKHPDLLKDNDNHAPHNDLSHMYDVQNATVANVRPQTLRETLAENSDTTQTHQGPEIFIDHLVVNSVVQTDPYCVQSHAPQTFTNELNPADQDLLNQAMSELEPTTSNHHQQNFLDNQSAPRKESMYSLYPIARKRILLKSYEDSQNQLMAAQSKPEVDHPGKQMPYKARVLIGEQQWRQEWQDVHDSHCGTSAITEISQGNRSAQHSYSTLNTAQHSLVSMLGSATAEDPMLLNDTRPPSHGPELIEHDVNELVNAYPNPEPSNWMYHGMDV